MCFVEKPIPTIAMDNLWITVAEVTVGAAGLLWDGLVFGEDGDIRFAIPFGHYRGRCDADPAGEDRRPWHRSCGKGGRG